MTEGEVRAIVREVIARRLGQAGGETPLAPSESRAQSASGPAMLPPAVSGPCVPVAVWKTHASHVRLVLPAGRDGDGPCLVEPEVGCTHCGFCLSFGH